MLKLARTQGLLFGLFVFMVSMVSEGFKKILKKQFLDYVKKAGLDPKAVDLQQYDFSSYYSVRHLVDDYAKKGDPVALKIREYLKMEEYGYRSMPTYEYEGSEEGENKDLAEVQAAIHNIYNEINKIRDTLDQIVVQNKAKEDPEILETIKGLKAVSSKVVELEKGLDDLRLAVHRLESVPSRQATLVDVGVRVGPKAAANKGPKARGAGERTRADDGMALRIVRLVVWFGNAVVLAYFFDQITGFPFLTAFGIIVLIGLLDTLVWLPTSNKFKRGVAAGYMYSQYSNPYKG